MVCQGTSVTWRYSVCHTSGWRPGKLLDILFNLGHPPTTKNHLDPKVNSARVEKPLGSRPPLGKFISEMPTIKSAGFLAPSNQPAGAPHPAPTTLEGREVWNPALACKQMLATPHHSKVS